MNIPEIYLIEPYNAYAPKGRKKHWHEIVEEQALMARIIAEQQAIQEAKSATTPPTWPPDSVATAVGTAGGPTGAGASVGGGGQPPPDFFNPAADVVDFSWAPTSGAGPVTVVFTNLTTTKEFDIYNWYFGDGTTSTDINPTHVYQTGSFTASLQTTNSVTLQPGTIKTKAVISASKPVVTARFTYTTSSGVAPATASFVNISTNTSQTPTTTYLWIFGDGSSSSLASPAAHPYVSNSIGGPQGTGSFTASLQASGSYGIYSLFTQSFSIPAPSLTALFTYTTTSLGSPISASFTNASTYNGKGVLTYLWIFGDGTTATTQNALNHPYTNTGSFTASLQVTESSYGIKSLYTQSFKVPDSTLTAGFTFTTSSNSAPSTATFLNTLNGAGGTQYNGSGVLTYLWNLGTGSFTATTQIPNPQSYTSNGPFTASLQVTESGFNHKSFYTQIWRLA